MAFKLTKAEHLQKAASLRDMAEKEPNPAERRDILNVAKRFELLAGSKRHPENKYAAAIETAIALASVSQERETVEAEDGSEVYAYPHRDGIAWGVNAAQTGVNVLRGIRAADGRDMAVG